MKAYQLGVYEKSMPNALTLAEKLTQAKSAGFDYLELSIDESEEKLARLDWGGERITSLLLSQREAGISFGSICLSGHRGFPMGAPDPAVRRRSREIMEKAIRLASTLGIRLIQLAGYDVYYQDSTPRTREWFAQGLREAADYAALYGVMLGFETMETPFMDTVQKAAAWVNEIRSPYLQVYPDVGNLTNAAKLYGHDVCGDLRAGRGHLAAVHLKETKPGVYRELPFGEGHVDFPAVTGCALELGVRRFVGEFWYTGQEDWREIMANNCAFLRGVLDRGIRLR